MKIVPDNPLKVIMFPNPSGSRYWRLEDPAKYLRKEQIEAWVSDEGITEQAAQWADIYVVQQCVDREGIGLLYAYQQEHGKKIIVDADDFPVVEDDNPYKVDHDRFNAVGVIKKTMEIADLITTTSEYLAGRLREINPNVVVLPNYMDLERWNQPKIHNTSNTIRIGWAGSMTHAKDLEIIKQPLERICSEYPQVQLIFVGETRVRDIFPGLPIEVVPGLPFNEWPKKLNGLQLDIALAPLRDTEFNRCKSNIKWQEYAIAKVPGVYSPTVYGERGFDGHFGMVAHDQEQWYRALKNLIDFPVLRSDIAESAFTHVTRRYDLSKHIQEWVDAYKALV